MAKIKVKAHSRSDFLADRIQVREHVRMVKNPKRATLKPCPFEGGMARFKPPQSKHMPHAIECTRCHASTTWYRLQSLAVDAWNRRTK